jgi:ABC-type multidrug transport system ATPase subunit
MSVQFQVENISKRFGQKKVIEGISFSLRDGQTLSITGSNGSGKSTLLRLCSGLLRPDSGNTMLFVDGDRVPVAGGKHTAAAAPFLRWYSQLTAIENIELIHGDDPYLKRRTIEYCERFGLKDELGKMLSAYSSGMVQRFALSAAFGSCPSLLLLDEPGAFLDEEGKSLFKEIFAEESAQRVSIIATNDSDESLLCEKEVRLG